MPAPVRPTRLPDDLMASTPDGLSSEMGANMLVSIGSMSQHALT